MNWTEITQVYRERNPRKGNNFEKSQIGSARVYISDKGRLFGEGALTGSGGGRRHPHGPSEQGPDDDDGGVAPASSWHWTVSGTTVSATQMFVEGAKRINATVEGNGDQFSCQLRVIFGKSDGQITRTGGRRGAPEQVLSSDVRDPTCQVVSGNVFAQ